MSAMPVTGRSRNLAPWLLLTFSLTKNGASLRVTVWRKLQVFGALAFGNSGYLLPNSPENQERFEWLAAAIRSGKGEASVVEVQSIDNMPRAQLTRKFSEARRLDYADLVQQIRKIRTGGPSRRPAALSRLRQKFQEIASIDFFGSPMKEEAERLLNKAFDSQESGRPSLQIARASRKEYRGRVWVTRPRPGVDRVTSAWLIRRFIDPKARFVFAAEDEIPSGAVPYDMYSAGFGHYGDDCSFETLVKAFRIRDKRVGILAQIVHDADLFDDRFGRKEGFGIDEVMKGWAQQGFSDRELLKRGMQLAEGLFQAAR
ncbi:MAG TPA: chromate resistance protein ChrB domain-containing protein [Candidatus Sulfotelmatobacter sp.]